MIENSPPKILFAFEIKTLQETRRTWWKNGRHQQRKTCEGFGTARQLNIGTGRQLNIGTARQLNIGTGKQLNIGCCTSYFDNKY